MIRAVNRATGLRRVPALTAAMVLAFTASGCSSGEDEVAYCVDQSNQVVDDDYCDSGYSGGGGYFIWLGSPGRSLSRGSVVPSGGTTINPTDSTARANAGLPSSGSYTSGSGGSRSGGFGTSIDGGGSSSHGGFGSSGS
ncbi:hypothetical protein SAMN05660324_0649 [Klenkia brasiliensis]|uniref:Lipoprotein n=1 Tax=Klenkia brasiliensis TaxID=333142 RepID=A0A1G7MHQ1_9ACTN|nr:hypothetical protein SAMN05660324_0649 [Klenkia brasiliensis]